MIVKLLGKQTSEDLSFLSEDAVIDFVQKLDKGGDPVDMYERFN
jgi:hypothetical protein